MYINYFFILTPNAKTTTIKGYCMKDYAKPFTEEEYKPIIEVFGGKYNAKNKTVTTPCLSTLQLEQYLRCDYGEFDVNQNEVLIEWK